MLPSIIFAIALSLPFSVAAVPPRRGEPLHIPILRRRSNVRRQDPVDTDHYAAVSSGLRGKYRIGSSSSLSRRGQTTDIGITNQVRLFYIRLWYSRLTCVTQRARIQATLPKLASALRECEHPRECLSLIVFLSAQKFNLVLDTGSSDLWFATSNCAGCSKNTPVLDTTKSSSIQLGTQRVSLNYGSGSASGVIIRDTITMGPFTVNPQTFGVYFSSFPPISVSTFLSPCSSCKLGVLSPGGTRVKCQWQCQTRR
jgi:aspartyl protease